MTTNVDLQGVIPVLSTPFNNDGDLDILTLKKEVEWVASQEVAHPPNSERSFTSCSHRSSVSLLVLLRALLLRRATLR